MRRILIYFCAVVIIGLIFAMPLPAQDMPPYPDQPLEVVTFKPDYIPPSEIMDFLGIYSMGTVGVMKWHASDGQHIVEIRHNDPANLIILSGREPDVDHVLALIREADIPPRQIEIEVNIIEINKTKANDIGLDWEYLLTNSLPRASWNYSEDWRDNLDITRSPTQENIRDDEHEAIRRQWVFSSTIQFSQAVKLLQEAGVGNARTAPRILTLNNRRATILDGRRVTYVTRYASYTNLFETDSMDAGVTVSVLPSIGESGYITLDIDAEMTSLDGSLSGSPIKAGQLIENTVIVKDGESVLLGGLTKTIEIKGTKRFPILGHVLPFIFSRETKAYQELESYMVLTPRIVDFSTVLDEKVKDAFDPPEVEEGK